MIIRCNYLSRKLRSLAYRTFNYLENNGNANFNTNGERLFLNNLLNMYQGMKLDRMVIFDIGSNTGDYIQMVLERPPPWTINGVIHLFEPMQACFDILNKRFSNYTLHNIVLNKKAVSNNNGVAKIFYDVDKSGLASLYKRNLNAYTINMDKFEMVETVRLDTYITERSIDHIHFLKLDIEGHELAALHGLGTFRSGEFIDFIQFEYGGANYRFPHQPYGTLRFV